MRHGAERRGDLLAVAAHARSPSRARRPSSGRRSMLSASCTSVTTCAVGRGQALRALDRGLQQAHGASARPRAAAAAARLACGRPTRTRAIAGRIAASGWRARATSRPGSTGSTIGTDPTQTRRYSASTLPTSNAGVGAPGAAPSRRAARGSGAAPRRRQRQAVVPAQVAVHERVRAGVARSSSSRPHTNSLAWMRATRS